MTRVPRRPIASPVRVPGTSLDRHYVSPPPERLVAQLGDIVQFGKFRWDVVAIHTDPPDETGRPRFQVQLERIEREEPPPGSRGKGKKKVVRRYADGDAVTVLGRQVLLPGLGDVS